MHILFETWKTFLSWDFFTAVVVETLDASPGSFSRSLSSTRIEFSAPRKFFCQVFGKSRQIVLPYTNVIHPMTDTTITDKLSRSNHFINHWELLRFSV